MVLETRETIYKTLIIIGSLSLTIGVGNLMYNYYKNFKKSKKSENNENDENNENNENKVNDENN